MSYVDGFVVAVPRANIEAYKEMARKGAAIWKEYGALGFVECIGDDVPMGEVTSFPRAVQAKEDEVVVFSWIKYKFTGAPRRRQCQGHGRPANQGEHVLDAVRRQADDLRRL